MLPLLSVEAIGRYAPIWSRRTLETPLQPPHTSTPTPQLSARIRLPERLLNTLMARKGSTLATCFTCCDVDLTLTDTRTHGRWATRGSLSLSCLLVLCD